MFYLVRPWEGENKKYFSKERDPYNFCPLYAKDNCPPELLEEYNKAKEWFKWEEEHFEEIYGVPRPDNPDAYHMMFW